MSEHEQQEWYYASASGERLGPVPLVELSSLAAAGKLEPTTLVWCQGYREWIPVSKIADLLVQARPPTPPGPSIQPSSEPEKNAGPARDVLDLKPHKGAFIFPRILGGCVLAGLVGSVSAGLLAAAEKSPWIGLAVFLGGVLLSFVASLASFRKERYQIQESRMICHRGGLVSDETNELEIRNITHVKLTLPWLRHKFFGVGDVIVQTSGNAKPVVLHLIADPEALYAELRERMRRNGYDLTQQQLLHEERPALIGILGECLRLILGTVVTCAVILLRIFGITTNLKSTTLDHTVLLILAVIGTAVLIFVILRFLDLRRRTYRVYNDVVVYEEGFLTCHYAFIPYENIADSSTKRSFFDQLLGLFDVQISCQGSSSEIKFRRLRNGVALSAVIDHLVVLARQKQKPELRSKVVDLATAANDRPRRHEPAATPVGEAVVGEFRMHAGRTIVPLLLLFPLLPIWIVVMVQGVIRLLSTQYSLRPGSLRHSTRFLTVVDREFTYDKITGLVIKQNPWDKLFGTLSLKFWSIGSGKPLEFTHISASHINLPALMRQVGIPEASADPYLASAVFRISTWLRAHLNLIPWLLLFVAGVVYMAIKFDPSFYYVLTAPALLGLLGLVWSQLYYSRQQLRFHDHHIEAEQGIFIRRRYFIRYSNVKRTRVTRYPGGAEGKLEVYAAAEEEVQQTIQQHGNQKGTLKHCSFISGFLPAAFEQGLLLDDILCGRVHAAANAVAAERQALLLESTRSVGTALTRLVLLSIVLLPLLVLLPITLPIMLVRVKRWRYRIESARIVRSWGVFYRSETSILLDRVDRLQQSQGPLNKLFRNGNVSITTAGCSKPDLDLTDSPDYQKLYEIIRENSQ
jgi:uncharacterized membrane protein YdbT with pleckstrin-like domain